MQLGRNRDYVNFTLDENEAAAIRQAFGITGKEPIRVNGNMQGGKIKLTVGEGRSFFTIPKGGLRTNLEVKKVGAQELDHFGPTDVEWTADSTGIVISLPTSVRPMRPRKGPVLVAGKPVPAFKPAEPAPRSRAAPAKTLFSDAYLLDLRNKVNEAREAGFDFVVTDDSHKISYWYRRIG